MENRMLSKLCCFLISRASSEKSLLPGPHISSSAKEKLDCTVLQHLRSWILVIKYRRNLNMRRCLQDIGSSLKLEKLQSQQHPILLPLGETHDSQVALPLFCLFFRSRVTSPELHLIKLKLERQSAGWFSPVEEWPGPPQGFCCGSWLVRRDAAGRCWPD